MLIPIQSLETARTLIRPIRQDDWQGMAPLTSDPEMWTYFTADLSIESELKAWVNSGINDSSRLAFTVLHKETRQIIGSTSIGNISERDRRAEIGWTWVGKPYQGKGYNAEVKLALLDYLFRDCDLARVELKTDVLNIPARKALLKIGLVEEGILRSHTQMIRKRMRSFRL